RHHGGKMRSRNETLDEGLRAIDPAGAEGKGREPRDGAADELLRTILDSDAAPGGAGGEGPHRRSTARAAKGLRRRRALAPLAVGAAALLVVIVGLPGGGGGRSTLPALARVAEAAAAQPSPDTGLPFLYVKTREDTTD